MHLAPENEVDTGPFSVFYIFASFIKHLVIETCASISYLTSLIGFIGKCMNLKER